MHGKALCKPLRDQSGASLLIALIMLIVVMLLGTTAARMVLMNEKSSRNDRDRQIAFQAAEAALRDAELALQAQVAKSAKSTQTAQTAPAADQPSGAFPAQAGGRPLWNATDARAPAPWIVYGHSSGYSFPHGAASLPVQPPRYLIEPLGTHKPGSASGPSPDLNPDIQQRYRITAVGFGSKTSTQVLLQTLHAIPRDQAAPVRLSWREINN